MAKACLSSDPLTLPNDQIVSVNANNANIISAYKDYARMYFCIKLIHPEFKPVPIGHDIPEFRLEEARKRYPFLFVDTNPLLWRKF
jgi:hypothetical protein